MRRSVLILLTTVLVLLAAATWVSLVRRPPPAAPEAPVAPAEPAGSGGPARSRSAAELVVVIPGPAVGSTSTTSPPVPTPPGADLVPEGGVDLAEFRDVAHATPTCALVVTSLVNRSTAPVDTVSVAFFVETGYTDPSGAVHWRAPQPFGRLARDGLDLAPGAGAEVDWEVCLSSFTVPTQAVRASPVEGSLDWSWRL